MEALATSVLGLFALGWISRRTGRLTPFSWARARVNMLSFTGENLAVVLSIVVLTTLLLSGLIQLGPDLTLSRWALSLSLFVVGGLAVFPRMTLAVLAAAGLVAELWLLSVEHGPEAAVFVGVWSMLLLWILGFIRGFIRPF